MITFTPAKKFSGAITPPASKSIAHRAVICDMLAQLQGGEPTNIVGLTDSDDILATERAAATFLAYKNGTSGDLAIDCGESGSTLRFLLPIAAALGVEATFVGSGRLPYRTTAPYKTLFEAHGCSLVFPEEDGVFLPATLTGRLRGGVYALRGDLSSQFVSGLLMSLAILPEDGEIILSTPLESEPYVEITRAVLRDFGIETAKTASGYYIKGAQTFTPKPTYAVECDWSQAAFFLCGKAATSLVRPKRGDKVELLGMNENSPQGDKAIVSIINGLQNSNVIDVADIPDLVPPLSVLLAVAHGTHTLTGAGRLRIKESDRLSSIAELINSIGGTAEIIGDTLRIVGSGGRPLRGGSVRSHNDHRIAMAAAIASLVCENDVTVDDFDCIKKSYPNFLDDFNALTGEDFRNI